MQLYIKQINGNIIIVDIEPTDLVHSIKEKIFTQEYIPIDRQRLIFCGKELPDNTVISIYNFNYNGNINLVVTNPQ